MDCEGIRCQATLRLNERNSMISRRVKISLILPVVTAAATSGMLGLSTNAHADSWLCGQSPQWLAGDYVGQKFANGQLSESTLTLSTQPSQVNPGQFHGLLDTSIISWSIVDSSLTIANKGGGTTTLVPGCSGFKLEPENLIGASDSDPRTTYTLARNHTP